MPGTDLLSQEQFIPPRIKIVLFDNLMLGSAHIGIPAKAIKKSLSLLIDKADDLCAIKLEANGGGLAIVGRYRYQKLLSSGSKFACQIVNISAEVLHECGEEFVVNSDNKKTENYVPLVSLKGDSTVMECWPVDCGRAVAVRIRFRLMDTRDGEGNLLGEECLFVQRLTKDILSPGSIRSGGQPFSDPLLM